MSSKKELRKSMALLPDQTIPEFFAEHEERPFCDAIMDEAYYIAPDGSYIIRARKDGGE